MKTRTLAFAAAVVGLVAACGHDQTAGRVVRTQPTTEISSIPPGPPAPEPGRCRLPVAVETFGTTGPIAAGGGFVSFPDGAYSPDPAANLAYSQAGGRWLPVPPSSIGPDGSTYAYLKTETGVPGTAGTSTLHLVTVSDGSDRVLWHADGFAVLSGYSEVGVLVATINGPPDGRTPPALHVISPAWVDRTFTQADFVSWVAGPGAIAWGVTRPNSPKGTVPPASRLVRLDLVSGRQGTWLSDAGNGAVIGFDSTGAPLLGTTTSRGGPTGDALIRLVVGPEKTAEFGTIDLGQVHLSGMPFVDAHGIWMGADDGSVWLASRQEGLRKVSTVPTGQPSAANHGQPALIAIAGPCL